MALLHMQEGLAGCSDLYADASFLRKATRRQFGLG
jgi:hypothetical protein